MSSSDVTLSIARPESTADTNGDDAPRSTIRPADPDALHRRLARSAVRQAAARYEQARADVRLIADCNEQYFDARRAESEEVDWDAAADTAAALEQAAKAALTSAHVELIKAILLASGKVATYTDFHNRKTAWPPCGVCFDGTFYVVTPCDHPDEPATTENESFNPACAGLTIVRFADIEMLSDSDMDEDTRDDSDESADVTGEPVASS
jgi:hypothetical protein